MKRFLSYLGVFLIQLLIFIGIYTLNIFLLTPIISDSLSLTEDKAGELAAVFSIIITLLICKK